MFDDEDANKVTLFIIMIIVLAWIIGLVTMWR